MDTLNQLASRPYTAFYKLDRRTDGTFCYVAWHPELPGCMSDGETPQEALENLEDARRLYIESLMEDHLPIPVPRPFGTKLELRPVLGIARSAVPDVEAGPRLGEIRQLV